MYVVSGCPRSGTSLMMDLCRVAFGEDRILGEKFPQEKRIERIKKYEARLDDKTKKIINYLKSKDLSAVEDFEDTKNLNPNGFWEMLYTVGGVYFRLTDYDNLERLKTEESKSICKIVSQGLANSDPQYIDKIVYMVRHPRAVAKSQERLTRDFPLNQKIIVGGREQKVHTPEMYIRVTIQACLWLLKFPHIPVLHVNFDDLIEQPERTLQNVQSFLGEGNFSEAATQIEPKLRRSKPEDVGNNLWEDAEAVYDLFIQKDYQGVIDYMSNENRATHKENKKYQCTRLKENKAAQECLSCINSHNTKLNFIKRANKKGIGWQNEPCIYECLNNDVDLEDSIENNSWFGYVEDERCKYSNVKNELYNAKTPCKGKKVLCQCPENEGMIWYSNGCNSKKCKFYESSSSALTGNAPSAT